MPDSNNSSEKQRMYGLMRDHPFVGEGEHCEAWEAPRSSGNSETGVITMRVGCGWTREYHMVAEEPDSVRAA